MSAPRTPAEVSESMTLERLVALHRAHVLALMDHRIGRGDRPLLRQEYVDHTVAVLAFGTAIAERVQSGRWVYGREALASGATAEQVGAAMGMHAEELCIGLALWASNQHRHGLMDAEGYEQVKRLIRGASS